MQRTERANPLRVAHATGTCSLDVMDRNMLVTNVIQDPVLDRTQHLEGEGSAAFAATLLDLENQTAEK
ncbi:hypothetical protein SAMN04490220_1220 [Rhodococcus jostii]|uniref:Uncharacterized protein n=1 Tax=Rhodococcus jostii TaxID=132919 RepID=A0A1H4R6F8_RHOJO|nr:hypothetical protein SAMN04490220_1220 [Rhodococcus jostii]